MNTKEFTEALTELKSLPVVEVKEISEDYSLPIDSVIMATWLFQAITDSKARDSFFERLYGKVKDVVQHEKKLSDLTDEELEALVVERLGSKLKGAS